MLKLLVPSIRPGVVASRREIDKEKDFYFELRRSVTQPFEKKQPDTVWSHEFQVRFPSNMQPRPKDEAQYPMAFQNLYEVSPKFFLSPRVFFILLLVLIWTTLTEVILDACGCVLNIQPRLRQLRPCYIIPCPFTCRRSRRRERWITSMDTTSTYLYLSVHGLAWHGAVIHERPEFVVLGRWRWLYHDRFLCFALHPCSVLHIWQSSDFLTVTRWLAGSGSVTQSKPGALKADDV